MAYGGTARLRARDLYFARLSLGEIARRTGIGLATLKRWKKEGEWEAQRAASESIERRSAEVAEALLEAVKDSKDPQQMYGAVKAAEMARAHGRTAPAPTTRTVAKALILVLSRDEEAGPLIRRRKDLVDAVAAEAERLAIAE